MTHTNTTHTDITHTITLFRREQEDTHGITVLCCLADDLSLSYSEDRDEYWILKEDTTAAAFLTVYKTEVTMWECCALTHPDSRRKGYLSPLLEQVCRYGEALGELELHFVTDNKCPATMAVLWELEAELWNEEYMMEYDVPAAGTTYESRTFVSQVSPPDTGPDAEPSTGLGMDIHATPERLLICARVPGDNSPADGNDVTPPDTNSGMDNVPGACVSCCLSLSDTSAYLCNLKTVPVLRRQRLAGRFLIQLIQHLERKGVQRIRLQISGSSEPTLWLYRETGSRITEAPSYYLY